MPNPDWLEYTVTDDILNGQFVMRLASQPFGVTMRLDHSHMRAIAHTEHIMTELTRTLLEFMESKTKELREALGLPILQDPAITRLETLNEFNENYYRPRT